MPGPKGDRLGAVVPWSGRTHWLAPRTLTLIGVGMAAVLPFTEAFTHWGHVHRLGAGHDDYDYGRLRAWHSLDTASSANEARSTWISGCR